MKNIDHILWCDVCGKTVCIVGDEYKGSPCIMFEYDTLVVSKEVYKKYYNELIFDNKRIKKPKICFID